MNRREMIGGTAALAISPVMPPAAKYARPHPDAGLIAGCDRYLVLEAEYRRLTAIEAGYHNGQVDHAAVRDAVTAAHDECRACVEGFEHLPAHTVDGLRAKARVVWAFYQPDPPEGGNLVDGLLWTVLCELAGVPA